MTVIFLIGVVIYYASVWGININLDDVTSPEYVPMYKSTFCSLSGMLALGLFIHNAIITIVSNNRYPENNVSISPSTGVGNSLCLAGHIGNKMNYVGQYKYIWG